MQNQNKNLILATVLSLAVIVAWTFLFPPQDRANEPVPVAATQTADPALPGVASSEAGSLEAVTDAEAAPTPDMTQRIAIQTPRLSGSISVLGGRIDDLYLNDYQETIEEDSPTVRLLRPVGERGAYYASFGWAAAEGIAPDAVPGPDTLWSLEGDNDTLTPGNPVTLAWDNGAGQVFRTTFSIDENYMFDVAQSVTNMGEAPIEMRPYGLIRRHGKPEGLREFFILNEGIVRMADGRLEEMKYSKMPDMNDSELGVPAEVAEAQESGWIGFTDHYWMTTLIPQQGTAFRSVQKYLPSRDLYQVEAVMARQDIQAGGEVSVSTRLFAGAKEWATIREYQNEGGVDRFVDSIDWGWFYFLTKPIFALLHWLNQHIGNMGWSIIALTLILKALVLPLAYKSYLSMAKMKELQPELTKLQERHKDDRQALQVGMMDLYKKNKVNPASGCLPMIVQIPIFFSLYKVIFVTIELRHAPWVAWIQDLSAPDPTSILNLFGLLPWGTPDPTSFFFIFSLGVLPIFLGISMWLQQRLNPTPPDPTQRMIFAWMPWVFMFMLGSFSSGLVLYWIANNVITFVQQYSIMTYHGHRPDLFGNIRGLVGKKKATDGPKDKAEKG
ncbi:inner membrane protein oxaA [Ketogulonicigenium robustum]|uniref:Membrane protein insertase YidC n=1 Tax=Ketogulonicigenium robustum TaxID=92947 RepID=A0A1W6P2E6_9RHOB|nr:membrane protein insertase YidC [Ketogulonicigenium robustum]ARO15510.1 inner membrane protein oxaA [Ketogulonicigenium robustum]